MKIHAIVSSYFGNNEWDLDACLRRVGLFCDTVYLCMDSRGGRPRGYVQKAPYVLGNEYPLRFGYLPAHQFFTTAGASEWRELVYAKAKAAWEYDDEDWVLFIDASEGLSIASDVLPDDDDWDSLDQVRLFKYHVLKEIAAVGSEEVIWIPTWAYVESGQPFSITEISDPDLEDHLDTLPAGSLFQGVPVEIARSSNRLTTVRCNHFYAYGGLLARLAKVSYLDDDPPWRDVDSFEEEAPIGAEASVSLSLVSYAYARWALSPDQLSTPERLPATEEWDIGFAMRKAISKVRDIPGLGIDSWPPDDSGAVLYEAPGGVMLPDGTSTVGTGGPDFFHEEFSGDFQIFSRGETDLPGSGTPVDPWPGTAIPLDFPLYMDIVRRNPMLSVYTSAGEDIPSPWNYFSGGPLRLTPDELGMYQGLGMAPRYKHLWDVPPILV